MESTTVKAEVLDEIHVFRRNTECIERVVQLARLPLRRRLSARCRRKQNKSGDARPHPHAWNCSSFKHAAATPSQARPLAFPTPTYSAPLSKPHPTPSFPH